MRAHKVEAPISSWGGFDMVRVSYQGYNDREDMEKLMVAVQALTERGAPRSFNVDRAIADLQLVPSPAPAS